MAGEVSKPHDHLFRSVFGEIERKAGGAPAWLYVLLEHQSTPDAWLRLRLLKYSIRIWERDRRRHPNEEQLRPIVPLVWYQGERGWRHACEFSELHHDAGPGALAQIRRRGTARGAGSGRTDEQDRGDARDLR